VIEVAAAAVVVVVVVVGLKVSLKTMDISWNFKM
jgi:hypothetical protein